jgi:two-component sensor histidine kinase
MAGPSGAYTLLEDVVDAQLAPVMGTYGNRITVEGPRVELGSTAAQQLALAVYELATNAVKYGALAAAEGTVRLSWQLSGGELTLRWDEVGSAVVADAEPPNRSGGFGTILVTRAIPSMLDGTAERRVDANGLGYVLTVPLARVAPDPRDLDGDYSALGAIPQ